MKIQKFLKESPLFNLALAYTEIIGDFQRRLSIEKVHFLEALVVTGLFFEERVVRPSELATIFSTSKSNMSHLLRSLERKGLVTRETMDEDARAYSFALTKDGKKLATKLIKIFDTVEGQIERGLGTRKVNPTLQLFREVYRNS